MSLGFAGERPVSDRDAVIKELQAQGKWKGENQNDNKTNNTGATTNTGTISQQAGKSNSAQKSNNTPFMHLYRSYFFRSLYPFGLGALPVMRGVVAHNTFRIGSKYIVTYFSDKLFVAQQKSHHATLYPKTKSRQPWHIPVVSNSLTNTLFLNSSISTLNAHNGHLHSLTRATLCPNPNAFINVFFSIVM